MLDLARVDANGMEVQLKGQEILGTYSTTGGGYVQGNFWTPPYDSSEGNAWRPPLLLKNGYVSPGKRWLDNATLSFAIVMNVVNRVHAKGVVTRSFEEQARMGDVTCTFQQQDENEMALLLVAMGLHICQVMGWTHKAVGSTFYHWMPPIFMTNARAYLSAGYQVMTGIGLYRIFKSGMGQHKETLTERDVESLMSGIINLHAPFEKQWLMWLQAKTRELEKLREGHRSNKITDYHRFRQVLPIAPLLVIMESSIHMGHDSPPMLANIWGASAVTQSSVSTPRTPGDPTSIKATQDLTQTLGAVDGAGTPHLPKVIQLLESSPESTGSPNHPPSGTPEKEKNDQPTCFTEDQVRVLEGALPPCQIQVLRDHLFCLEKKEWGGGRCIPLSAFRSLRPRRWLSGDVINMFLQLVNVHRPEIKYFGWYFMSQLVGPPIPEKPDAPLDFKYGLVAGYAPRAFENSANLFEQETICIPVHRKEGNHWSLVVVFPKKKIIEYYDSLLWSGKEYVETVYAYLRVEWKKAGKGDHIEAGGNWTLVSESPPGTKEKPNKQPNDYDCGVFLCHFVGRLFTNFTLPHTEAECLVARNKLALLILFYSSVPKKDWKDESSFAEYCRACDVVAGNIE